MSNYQCFIDGTYRVQNPEIYEDVNSSSEKQEIIYQLKACLAEQLQLLEEGMKLHQRKCLTDMRPLHNHLYLRFQEMKMKLTQLLQVVD